MGKLVDKYGAPPFSVLDARQKYWMVRKAAWKQLGLGQPLGKGVFTSVDGLERMQGSSMPSVSVFDPFLCELLYSWFAPAGGRVLDPFAGGVVRGFVAAALGLEYTGVDVRADQVANNEAEWKAYRHNVPGHETTPVWLAGDSREVVEELDGGYDFLFSCPPYAHLERYSDDPQDLSNMRYPAFKAAYREIIRQAVAKLKPNRFCCWVVGEVRAKAGGEYVGLVPDTIQAFTDAGAAYYNEAVLVTPAGSLPLRVGGHFDASRKLGKAHQNVLVFFKGKPTPKRVREVLRETPGLAMLPNCPTTCNYRRSGQVEG
jgi:ribonuclease HI